MSRNRHPLAAVLTAALQLALSFGLTANLVFCTAASGHVAVESAYGAECCDGHVLPEGLRDRSDDGGCGCVDTPILQSPATGRRLEYAPPAPQTLLPPAFLPPDLMRAPATARAAASPRSWAPEWALAVRRSVVLLV